MPDIPLVPGIPSITGAIPEIVSLLTQDAVSLIVGLIGAPWGIYLDGIPIIQADTVASFSYKQEESILDFPVEGGNFESYGKVHVPYDCRLKFASGGNRANRQLLIDSCRAIIDDTNIYDVVTPDNVYLGLNCVHMDYSQTGGDGVGLVQIEIWMLQVRIAPSAFIPLVTDAQNALQFNGGVVQAISATATQQNFLPAIVGGLF